MKNNFKNKTLLITGGTGSFGNAVVKRFLTTDIKEIRIFSRDEKKQDDMRKKYKENPIKIAIAPPYLSVITPNKGLNTPQSNNCNPITNPK